MGTARKFSLEVWEAESLPIDLWSGHLRYFYGFSRVVELCIEI
jgi:hypothetical protein